MPYKTRVTDIRTRPLSDAPAGSLVLLARPMRIGRHATCGPFIVFSVGEAQQSLALLALEGDSAHRMTLAAPTTATVFIHIDLDLIIEAGQPVRSNDLLPDFFGGICVTDDGPRLATSQHRPDFDEYDLRWVSLRDFRLLQNVQAHTWVDAPWFGTWTLSGMISGERVVISRFPATPGPA